MSNGVNVMPEPNKEGLDWDLNDGQDYFSRMSWKSWLADYQRTEEADRPWCRRGALWMIFEKEGPVSAKGPIC